MVAAFGCAQREWVALRPEPEAYPLESAKRICDHHAEKQATVYLPGPTGWPSDRDTYLDAARYQRLFTRCMEHYGWVLQTVPDPEEPPAPAEQRGGQETDRG